MKNIEKEKAVKLRSEGESIKSIAKKLNVSSSSVSTWVRHIQLSDEQMLRLKENNPIYNNQHKGAKSRQEKARQKRLEYQKVGKNKAKENNLLHMAGCMLYWAEGAKHRSDCKFSNSDVNMIKFYLKFLKEVFNIKNNDIRLHINCYTNNGLTVEEIENYWITELNLPKECLNKTTTDNLSKYSQQKKSKNKLLYGTIEIRIIKSVWLIQHIFGAIQEYTGRHNDYGVD